MEFSKSSLAKWLDELLELVYRNGKIVLCGIAAIAGLGLASLGYSYYDAAMQARAHKAFMEGLKFYNAAVVAGSTTVTTGDSYQFGSDEEKWKAVEATFATTLNDYKSTRLGAVLRAYYAEALAHCGKFDGALAELKRAVADMPNEDVQDFYKVKLALMKTDSSDKSVEKEGIEELKLLAGKSGSVAHETALYYTGLYFWTEKEFATASNYWQQLMVKYGLKDAKAQSPYAELVRSKLKLISAEW